MYHGKFEKPKEKPGRKVKRRRIIALIMCMMMLTTLFTDNSVSIFASIDNGANSSSGSIATVTDATGDTTIATTEEVIGDTTTATTEETSNVTTAATTEESILEGEDSDITLQGAGEISLQGDAASHDIFDDTSITLDKVTLTAQYVDDDNNTVTKTLSTTGDNEVPENSKLNMKLEYTLGDGNKIVVGDTYTYQMPNNISIDVSESQSNVSLKDNSGNEIGTAKINKDTGTIDFVFNDRVKGQEKVYFYVWFNGEFSGTLDSEDSEDSVDFPISGGTYSFNVKTTDTCEFPSDTEPNKTTTSKSGQIVKAADGSQYIEWTIGLSPNNLQTMTGEITDNLLTGMTYLPMDGYPKLEGSTSGTVSTSNAKGDTNVVINVNDVTTTNQATVKFCTTFDPEAYFTANGTYYGMGTSIKNTASYNSDDPNDTGTSASHSIWYSPSLVSKTGSNIDSDGNITWTIVVNKDGLNVAGATLADTLGAGQSYVDGSFECTPAGSGLGMDSSGAFTGTITADASGTNTNTYTITYKTKVDYSVSVSSYTNIVELKKGTAKGTAYDAISNGSVKPVNLVTKTLTKANSITNEYTWTITVNPDKLDLQGETTVKDTFPSTWISAAGTNVDVLKYVSSSYAIDGVDVASASAARVTKVDTETITGVIYTAKNLGEHTLTITVHTKIKDDIVAAYNGQSFNVVNQAVVETQAYGTSQPVKPSTYVTLKQPDYVDKSGTNNGDGTITWKVTMLSPSGEDETDDGKRDITSIDFTDTLPANTEYVAGTMKAYPQEWEVGQASYAVDVTPTVSGDETTGYTLKVKFDESTYPTIYNNLDKGNNRKAFVLVYDTKPIDANSTSGTFTNTADVKVTYPDGINKTDGDSAVVTGDVGGVLDKTASYKQGEREVTWTVMINEGRFDMSEVTDPILSDELAEYFDYVKDSASLYLVSEDGTETQVTSGFSVICANNKLVVQMPNIDKNCYKLVFQTRFNTYDTSSIDTTNVRNTINFTGKGVSKTTTSDKVKNIAFSSAGGGAETHTQIRIKKVDSSTGAVLEGAVFKLVVSGTEIASATTDSNGYATFEDVSIPEGTEIIFRETQAPEGYALSEQTGYKVGAGYTERKFTYYEAGVKDDAGNTYSAKKSGSTTSYDLNIKNEKPTAATTDISVKKVDSAGQALAGAEFTLYYANGNVAYTSETDTDGIAKFTAVFAGKYYVKETKAPDGYKINTDIYRADVTGTSAPLTVTYTKVTEIGDTTTTGGSEDVPSIADEKATATLNIYKATKDSSGSETKLNGAKFGLYTDKECSNEVANVTTANATATKADGSSITGDGIAVFKDLEPGKTYYYKELEAPAGYVLDSTVYSITVGDSTTNEDVYVDAPTVYDEPAVADINITKTDDSNNALSGVEFTLYNTNAAGEATTPYKIEVDEDNDGVNETVNYKVKTGTTGKASFADIPFGTYVIRETDTPDEYVAADPVVVTLSSTTDIEKTIVNNKKKFSISIVKTDGTNPLAGAVFEVYTVVNGGKGTRVATSSATGSDGKVTIANLDYGEYILSEKTAPYGYNKAADITISKTDLVDGTVTGTTASTGITGTYTAGNVVLTEEITDTKQNGSLTFKKTSTENAGATPVAQSGAKFKLTDADGAVIKENLTSGSDGIVEVTNLAYGTYYVSETQAVDGYIMDTNSYKIVVVSDTSTSTKYYDKSGAEISELVINNEKINNTIPIISFKVKKTDGDGNALAGATFAFYKNGVVAATATTDSEGIAYFRQVSVEDDADDTVYTVQEVSAPTGYTKSDKVITIADSLTELSSRATTYRDYKSDGTGASYGTPRTDTEISFVVDTADSKAVDASNPVVDTKILGTITVTKTDSTNSAKLDGTEFTLYKRTITDGVATDEVYMVDGNAYTAVTGASGVTGVATFTGLPVGTYVVKESKPTDGYTLNTQESVVNIVEGSTTPSVTFKDSRLSLKISKKVVGGASELAGAKLELYDSSSTTTPIWKGTTSGTEFNIGYSKLKVGETYTLKEVDAPNGYGFSEDVQFTINNDGSISLVSGSAGEVSGKTVTMRDTEINLSVSKVEADATDSTVAATPITYVKNATMAIIDKLTGEEVITWNSGDAAYAIDKTALKAASTVDGYRYYIVREKVAPTGYEIAADKYFAVDHYGKIWESTNGTSVTGSANDSFTLQMLDSKKADGTIYIRKVDSRDNSKVENATFSLYQNGSAARYSATATKTGDITWSSDSSADFAIKLTDIEGFDSNTSTTYTYVIKETGAPDGYFAASDTTFTVAYDATSSKFKVTSVTGADASVNNAKDTITIKDKPIELYISKQNAFYSGLTGAKLELYKITNTMTGESKSLIASYTTNGSPITVNNKYLAIDCIYELHEVSAPDGYMVADDVRFRIDSTGKVYGLDASGSDITDDSTEGYIANNYVTMVDGEAGLSVAKVTAESGSSNTKLAGCTLRIESIDDTHFDSTNSKFTWVSSSDSAKTFDITDFTPGCTYQLVEVDAADGYAFAEPIKFMVKDDHSIKYLSGSNNGKIAANRTIYMSDSKLTLKVSKMNSYNITTPVNGAVLAIIDADTNKEVTRFTTTKAGQVINTSKLSAGDGTNKKAYILREIKAPEGYNKAADIYFAFDSEGVIYLKDSKGAYTTELTDNMIFMMDMPQFSVSKQDANGKAVAGAKLTITSTDDAAFTTISWTSEKTAKVISIDKFTAGKTYVLSEETAPKGYAYAESIEFTVSDDGEIMVDGVADEDRQLVLTDDAIDLQISKIDSSNGKGLAGASMMVVDSSANVLYSFTSEATATTVPSNVLTAPKTGYNYYILREVTAPEGYDVAEDVGFAIDSTGTVYVYDVDGNLVTLSSLGETAVVMEDEPSKYVSVSTIDITDGSELPGAENTITDEDGNVIDTWTSTNSRRPINKKRLIPNRDYKLTQEFPPDGYEVVDTDEITFKIDEDGNVYVKDEDGSYKPSDNSTITMKDKPITYITFNVVDITDDHTLTNAKLTITDKNGDVVDSWESSLVKKVLSAKNFIVDEEYTLTQISAPDGYDVATTMYFKIDEDGNVYIRQENGTYTMVLGMSIVMKDPPLKTTTTPPTSITTTTTTTTTTNTSTDTSSVKTGDRAPIVVVMMVMVAALVGFGSFAVVRKKEEE